MENPLIIEFFYEKEETSVGVLEKKIPTIRFIYFDIDIDTGAKSVHDIMEIDLRYNNAAHIAIHYIRWTEHFDGIKFVDVSEDSDIGTFYEFELDTNNAIANVSKASTGLHMIYAHALGYLDWDGSVSRDHPRMYTDPEAKGENIFKAHKTAVARDECIDYYPYLVAGTEPLPH